MDFQANMFGPLDKNKTCEFQVPGRTATPRRRLHEVGGDDGGRECGAADVGCILSYAGDGAASALNYALLALTVAAAAYELSVADVPAETRGKRVRWQAAALGALAVYQVGLCMALGCAGVSIVWNGVAAFLLCAQPWVVESF